MSFLHTLRSKSNTVKRRYAFGVAAILTLFVGAVWFSALPARIAQIGELLSADRVGEATSEVNENIGNSLEAFKTSFSDLELPEEVIEREVTVTVPENSGALGNLGLWSSTTAPGENVATSSALNNLDQTASSTVLKPQQAYILIATTTKKTE